MNSESNTGANEPLEFKVLEYENSFLSGIWMNGTTKLGSDKDLESILNSFGSEGWDVIQYVAATAVTNRLIFLRRRAR